MNQAVSVPRSTLSKKILMAATGLLLVGFVLGHMVGNLKAFQGAEKFDSYAHFIREAGYPVLGHGQLLWILRIGLLASVLVHLWAAVGLWWRNRSARPVGYRRWRADASSYASRTMIWGGVIIFFYVIYHLLHFTTGQAHPDFVPGAAYANLVIGFSAWPVVAVYLIAQIALGFHLYHGFWSAFRTLGGGNPRNEGLRRGAALVVAGVVTLGFVSVPIAVLAGIIR